MTNPTRPRRRTTSRTEVVALVQKWLADSAEIPADAVGRAAGRRAQRPERPRLHGRLRRRRDAPGRPDGRRATTCSSVAQDGPGVPALVHARRHRPRRRDRRPCCPGWSSPPRARVLRQMVGHLVVDATPDKLGPAIAQLRAGGNRLNLNLLGEAVLGEKEALRRLEGTRALLARDDVDYVSIKVSADRQPALDVGVRRGRRPRRRAPDPALPSWRPRRTGRPSSSTSTWRSTATSTSPSRCSSASSTSRGLQNLEAGIVLQAYLPDALGALQGLTEWAQARRAARRRADQGARRQGREPRHGARRRGRARLAARDLLDQAGHRHQLQARARLGAHAREHGCRARSASPATTSSTSPTPSCSPSSAGWPTGVEFEMLLGMATSQAEAVQTRRRTRCCSTRRS